MLYLTHLCAVLTSSYRVSMYVNCIDRRVHLHFGAGVVPRPKSHEEPEVYVISRRPHGGIGPGWGRRQ